MSNCPDCGAQLFDVGLDHYCYSPKKWKYTESEVRTILADKIEECRNRTSALFTPTVGTKSFEMWNMFNSLESDIRSGKEGL